MSEKDTGATAVAGPLEIGCDVCTDLIPLVRDGVASEESRRLVLAHVQRCPVCKHFLEQGEDASEKAQNEKAAQADDRKVLAEIQKRLTQHNALRILGAALLGFGVSFSYSKYMFLNIALMPLVGALALYLFPKRWYLVAPVVFALTFVVQMLMAFPEFHPPSALFLCVVYTALALLGVLILLLLRFAFGKESESY